jgi:hypothetical protein
MFGSSKRTARAVAAQQKLDEITARGEAERRAIAARGKAERKEIRKAVEKRGREWSFLSTGIDLD